MDTAQIRAKSYGDTCVLYPGPYLNQLRGEDIENRCQNLLSQGVRQIVINFDETELINSIGVSILLGVIDAVNDASGVLILSNLNTMNRELFEMLGLLSYVRVEPTEKRALATLGIHAGMPA